MTPNEDILKKYDENGNLTKEYEAFKKRFLEKYCKITDDHSFNLLNRNINIILEGFISPDDICKLTHEEFIQNQELFSQILLKAREGLFFFVEKGPKITPFFEERKSIAEILNIENANDKTMPYDQLNLERVIGACRFASLCNKDECREFFKKIPQDVKDEISKTEDGKKILDLLEKKAEIEAEQKTKIQNTPEPIKTTGKNKKDECVLM